MLNLSKTISSEPDGHPTKKTPPSRYIYLRMYDLRERLATGKNMAKMHRFSLANLLSMRAFAEAYIDEAIV
jgi:hypothetical protein